MANANVGISQRGVVDATNGQFVFRNFSSVDDRYTAQFSVTAIDGQGRPIDAISTVTGLVHGSLFSFPASSAIDVQVVQTSGDNTGDSQTLSLQPYTLVAPGYDIFHFFHEELTEVVWAIGSPTSAKNQVVVLRSSDYFTSFIVVWTIDIPDGDKNLNQYRSIYIDQYDNIIIGWRPGPLIWRSGARLMRDASYRPTTDPFVQLFSWMDPDNGLLCPFWNITEDDIGGRLIISEYGSSTAAQKPHGSHRGIFRSSDPLRATWRLDVVDAGFDANVTKFSGYFRHIHGYHVNPDFSNIHHMFLGDTVPDVSSDGTPGYYVSQDGGRTWSTEIITQWPGGGSQFYNGPCFVTWWPNGQAFITSDTAETGRAYWWGSGPSNWGGPGFSPVIELRANVDEESESPDTPWMAMAVKNSYETYCTTASSGHKEILWRYDWDKGKTQVLAEVLIDPSASDPSATTLRWLSGSRHNRIPSQAQYFFTSRNRRFSRRGATPSAGRTIPDGTYKVIGRGSGKALDVSEWSVADGAGILQWPYGGGDNQRWLFAYQGNGYYKITALHSGKALDVSSFSTEDGADVLQWPWHGGDNQLWQVAANGDGTYRLVSKHSAKVLNVLGASTADGAKVNQWTWSNAANQQWWIQPP
ncbi:RICIN domain-containing protein [Sorangium sp. So ce128]|uniref:RICIN domain-containing protein n=1 Tax=Sorangium sp. So ce128 TaxID=3133281 RepID=UPI003F618DB2